MTEDDLQLDEHDIEELEQLLSELKNDDALHLDGVHGLLTALAVGPELVSPQEWLPVVLGAEPVVEDIRVIEEIITRTVQLSNAITRGLEHFTFDPVFASSSVHANQVEVGGWCEGFSLGIDLRAAVWEAQMHTDGRLVDLLAPIVKLGVDDGVFAELSEHDIEPLSEGERDELIQALPAALFAVRHYWDVTEPVFSSEGPSGARLH
jgi:uncharacterized protein